MLNKLLTDTVSQSLQTEKVVKSECKVKSKLLHNIQKLSTGNPANMTNLQLASEQYISIFNRYQVFHAIIIFLSFCRDFYSLMMIIFNYY